ncbi:hypothetical protein IAT38_001095 [Cryptococcus sp. DSM 104549]
MSRNSPHQHPSPVSSDGEWRSPERHSLFKPPSSPLALQSHHQPHPLQHSHSAPAPAIASMDLILDASLIPSLPESGGRLAHFDLMGRAKMPTPPALPPKQHQQQQPKAASLDVPKPTPLRRSSSYEDRAGNRAGVGAGRRSPASSDEGRGGHTRNWSAGSADTVKQRKGLARPGAGVRRISSFDGPVVPGHGAKLRKGHGRTASDSTMKGGRMGSLVPPPALQKPGRTTSLVAPEGSENHGLALGSLSDKRAVIELLTTLQALTPTSRTPIPPPPPPSTTVLSPLSLLTPMAIILEALVWERQVLKGDLPRTKLPSLRDGSSFQLAGECGGGGGDGGQELDWKVTKSYILAVGMVTKSYILAVGMVLDSVVPFLRECTTTSRGEGMGVEELTKSVRAYVGKMKKVFGEVAAMYVDGYGFVRGWWDESPMKGAAGEVGRWGDLFDA